MTFDERLEHDLDAWWDDEAAGRAHPHAAGPEATDVETIQRLHAANPPAVPTPNFVNSLREDLMQTAKQSGAPRPLAAPPYFKQLRTYDVAAPQHMRERSRPARMAFVQVAVAAALILGLVGAAYGGGVFDRFSDRPTPIPAVLGAKTATTPAPVSTNATANYRGDASRSGQMPGPAPVGAPTLVWKNTSGGTNPSALAVEGGRVFSIVNTDGTGATYPYLLKAIDLQTGADLWSVGLDAKVESAPAVADGFVYAETKFGIVAFNQTNGTAAWSYSTGGYDNGATHGTYQPNGPAPAIANGTLYFSVEDATLRAIDAKTGIEKWSVNVPGSEARPYDTYGPFNAAPVSVDNGVIYGPGAAGLAFAIDANSGHSRWTFQTQGEITAAPVVDGDRVYLASAVTTQSTKVTSGRLYGLDAKSGKQLWPPTTVNSSFRIATADQLVFVSSATLEGTPLIAFNGVTGKQMWTYAGAGNGFAPTFVFGQLFFTGTDGSVDAVNALTGELSWSVFLNWISDPVIVDGMLIAGNYGGIFAIGGDGNGAPVASPPADLSGLPACTPPGAVPTKKLTGTPKYVIDAESQLKTWPGVSLLEDGSPAFTEWPQLLTENVPTGNEATAAQTTQIQETLGEMRNCWARVDGERLMQGFFTSDFFRRGGVYFGPHGYRLTWGTLQPEQTEIDSLTTVVLNDGRIAARIAPIHNPGEFIIFRQQDGHWMIDEVYKIVDQYNWSQPG